MKRNKIGIFGIGAIGSVISMKISRNQNQIHYYNRSPKEEIIIINENRIESRVIKLSNTNSKNPIKLDWLIICLKEYQYKAADKDIEYLIGPTTNIAVIRNGINLKAPILNHASEDRIVACMIDCPTQMNKYGEYLQLRKPTITTSKRKLSQKFTSLFIKNKIDIIQVDNYDTKNWEKLIESSALGGILSLSGESCWIFKDKEMLNLYKRMVDEGIKVAEAEGVTFKSDFKNRLIKKLLAYPDTKESSMLLDRRIGNPIELNAKNGIIAQLGKKHGINTEINDMVSLLLRYTNNKEKTILHKN